MEVAQASFIANPVVDVIQSGVVLDVTVAAVVTHRIRIVNAYRKALSDAGIASSMSRSGNCWDNAPTESFFSSLKNEWTGRRTYRSKQEAKRDLFEYIEVFYNRRRLHSAIGYLPPAEYESRWLTN